MTDDMLRRLREQRQRLEREREEIRHRLHNSLDEIDAGRLATGTGVQAIRRAFERGIKQSDGGQPLQ
ncbi:MAG: hypothetical protein KI792_10655 [Alphaproteobacteria bacterium]|nr:hypothetical protein [Alphaproteobacteria bacterium SS10]